MSNQEIQEQLREIKELLKQKNKRVLNLGEVAEYIGFAKSYIYKLTSNNQIPYYKPSGKGLFFDKEEIDNWLLANKNEERKEVKRKISQHKGDWKDFELKDSDWPEVEWPKEDK